MGLDLVQEDYNGVEEVVVALEGRGEGSTLGKVPGQPLQDPTLGISMISLSTITLKCGGCREDW